jgi:hypothetical protein
MSAPRDAKCVRAAPTGRESQQWDSVANGSQNRRPIPGAPGSQNRDECLSLLSESDATDRDIRGDPGTSDGVRAGHDAKAKRGFAVRLKPDAL